MRDTYTVKEVADRLGKAPVTVRMGIMGGSLPFGTPVKCTKAYAFIIPKEKFEKWLRGEHIE